MSATKGGPRRHTPWRCCGAGASPRRWSRRSARRSWATWSSAKPGGADGGAGGGAGGGSVVVQALLLPGCGGGRCFADDGAGGGAGGGAGAAAGSSFAAEAPAGVTGCGSAKPRRATKEGQWVLRTPPCILEPLLLLCSGMVLRTLVSFQDPFPPMVCHCLVGRCLGLPPPGRSPGRGRGAGDAPGGPPKTHKTSYN